jgi:hypothetical protein
MQRDSNENEIYDTIILEPDGEIAQAYRMGRRDVHVEYSKQARHELRGNKADYRTGEK